MNTVIFDKSFIRNLSADEFFELDLFFDPVGTSILRREILAELTKKPDGKSDNIAVLKSLAGKMADSGLEVMEYRKAALLELAHEQTVRLDGVLLIDGGAPYVTVRSRGVSIDGRELQSDWRRLASGSFSEMDKQIAREHRERIAPGQYDPQQWRERFRHSYGATHFDHCKNLDSLISHIDQFFDRNDRLVQRLILDLSLNWLSAPDDIAVFARRLFNARLMPKIESLAPYAVAVMRITFVYQIALARGFFGPRPSDLYDLEYLYYAPFCRVFVSSDRLHRNMWRATRSTAIFVEGAVMKADLKRRAVLRKENPDLVAGPYPIPLEGSVITETVTELNRRRQDRRRRRPA